MGLQRIHQSILKMNDKNEDISYMYSSMVKGLKRLNNAMRDRTAQTNEKLDQIHQKIETLQRIRSEV